MSPLLVLWIQNVIAFMSFLSHSLLPSSIFIEVKSCQRQSTETTTTVHFQLQLLVLEQLAREGARGKVAGKIADLVRLLDHFEPKNHALYYQAALPLARMVGSWVSLFLRCSNSAWVWGWGCLPVVSAGLEWSLLVVGDLCKSTRLE